MPTLSLTSNADAVTRSLRGKLEKAFDRDRILRVVVVTLLAETKKRIFEMGLASDGLPIGEYSEAYLRRRIAEGRGPSRKVILQLTDKMSQDYTAGARGEDYGLGFRGAGGGEEVGSYDKANYAEENFRRVWALTPEERQRVREVVIAELRRGLVT